MLRKISTLFVALMMLAMMVNAQDHAILTPGDQLIPIKGKTIEAALTGAKVNVMNHQKVGNIILKGQSLQNAKGTIDTISIKEMSGANFNVNFGFFDQDVMIQWYVAPADLIIKGIGFMPSDVTGADNGVAVSLVKTNLTASDLVAMGAPAYWGYWESTDGWNGAAPFEWQASGDWVPGTEGAVAPWTEDIWSDFGDGYVVTPVLDPNAPAYNWVVLNDALGFEPDQINRGEVFGIVMKNNGVDETQPDGSRIGLLSAGDMATHPGFKYYAKGRLSTTDQGWWARKYTWDVVAAVDLVGDRPPVITNVDVLPTTLSTEARTVTATITDDNPSGGDAGVASAAISYTTDGGTTWNDVAMTANGDVYSGDIPGQQPGTTVDYKIVATDVNNNTAEAGPWEYNIFMPVNSTLLVFNGYAKPAGYPQSYYFGQDDFVTFTPYPFEMDVWSFGKLTPELVNHYTNIIDITTTGPKVIDTAVVKDWLAADGGHNYMLAGDEWFGAQSGWTNKAHKAGEFIFDVLGANYEYNDINYAASGDQTKPSIVMPVEGTLLGGPLFTKYTEISDSTEGADTMLYNPYFEISVSNWLDGADFEADVEVDMQAVGVDGNTYNIAGHRTLAAGNKIAFLTYDPLSLDASPYYWYGFSASAPQVQTALWFGVTTGVSPISNEIPNGFALSQNYPNPFNPTTQINFALKVDSKVQLKVYNLLGQVVASEVYGNLNAGTHKYTFDGSNLTSGVYFYNISVEGVDGSRFSATKKMMLLK